MDRSEENRLVNTILQGLIVAQMTHWLESSDVLEASSFVDNLIAERDTLRSVVVRQEAALIQHARGTDAERLQDAQ